MERSSSSSSSYRRHHQHSRSDTRNNPSFSSTLLDSIYRSFDDPSSAAVSTDRRRNSRHPIRCVSDENINTTTRLRQNGAFRRKSVGADMIYSSSSSSDSSYGAGLTGFESADDSRSNLKPIRTSSSASAAQSRSGNCRSDGGGEFVKKKSRSLKKMYGDLKKAKHPQQPPISPGGRLASFLNSLFTAGNVKKAKFGGGGNEIRPSDSSNCSSASSFSRSCLSKTPSSRGGGGKRSVRFYPVNVIVDEESRPCGHRNIMEAENEELKLRVMKESRRVEAAARELLKNYSCQRKSADVEDEEDDDVVSCASSDLFELDNLSAIGGIERYREELPVYETTHLSANHRTAGYYC